MALLSKAAIFKTATITLGLVVGLAIVEIALRAVGYARPEFYQPSLTLGVELIPGMSGWYSKEGRSWVEINSDGQRDIDRAVEKPANTFRIAVVGDSYVEALQVDADERFTRFLEQHLGGCETISQKQVEVLSFGVSGYGTAQELLLAREKVWKYQPDVLLLLITTNNDVTDNLRVFKGTAIPYFVLKNEGLELDDSFRSDPAFLRRSSTPAYLGRWMTNNLRVFQGVGELSSVAKKYWQSRRDAATPPVDQAVFVEGQQFETIGDVGIDNQIYRPPADANWEQAWRVTEELLGLFRQESAQRGAKFVAVTGSNGIQVWPDPRSRELFARRLGVSDLRYPDLRIAAFGKADSIRVISLVEELGLYAEQNKVYLHGFGKDIGNGHWNQLGHRVAGEVIAEKLCRSMSDQAIR